MQHLLIPLELTLFIALAVPIVGMLCGATISGMIVALNYILKELQYVYSSLLLADSRSLRTFRDNRDIVETYLAFGASRFEACRPMAIQALKLALTPPINSMRCIFFQRLLAVYTNRFHSTFPVSWGSSPFQV
jgi:ABC-type iron transport system FetAB permease component